VSRASMCMMDAKADVGKFATASIIMPHDHGFATKVTDKLEDLIGLIFLPIVSPLALRSRSTHRPGVDPTLPPPLSHSTLSSPGSEPTWACLTTVKHGDIPSPSSSLRFQGNSLDVQEQRGI